MMRGRIYCRSLTVAFLFGVANMGLANCIASGCKDRASDVAVTPPTACLTTYAGQSSSDHWVGCGAPTLTIQ